MKLNEKIYHCRKKAGYSQEALAEKIGVSRQAISKWETGEAAPEISKLPLLAKTFGVTADWLLSEEDAPQSDAPEEPAAPGGHPYAPCGGSSRQIPDWVDRLPGFLGRLIRQYGWIVGVRMAIGGALFAAMGLVGKAMFRSIGGLGSGPVGGMSGGITAYDSAGNVIDIGDLGLSAADLGIGSSFDFNSPFGFGVSSAYGGVDGMAVMQPAMILCNFIIGVGVVLLVGGAVLAWYLKKKGAEQ